MLFENREIFMKMGHKIGMQEIAKPFTYNLIALIVY